MCKTKERPQSASFPIVPVEAENLSALDQPVISWKNSSWAAASFEVFSNSFNYLRLVHTDTRDIWGHLVSQTWILNQSGAEFPLGFGLIARSKSLQCRVQPKSLVVREAGDITPEEATDNSWTQLMALFPLVSQNQSIPLIVSYDPSQGIISSTIVCFSVVSESTFPVDSRNLSRKEK